MIAKSTSETWYELANDACGEVDLLYRTEMPAVKVSMYIAQYRPR